MKRSIPPLLKLPLGPKDAGFSLVSVLVSAALLGIFAVMGSQSFKNLNTSARRVESKTAVRDLEHVAVNAIAQRFKDYISVDRCTTNPRTYFSNVNIGDLGSLSYSTIQFRNNQGGSTQAPTEAAADLRRCSSTPFARGASPQTVSTFYSCLNVATSSTAASRASTGSFAANNGAFIEVLVNIRDLRTDARVNCGNIAGNGFGIEIYYNMHWTTKDPTRVIYDSKVGTLNAAL